jgi:DNA-binding response OmpR family regulator
MASGAKVSRDTKILIVDDQEENVRLLERMLQQAGYVDLKSTTDPREVSALYLTWEPDLVILDLIMPHLDGYQVMEQVRSRLGEQAYLPILVLTADVTPQAKQRALSGGATDFLTKPFDAVEVVLRVSNLLQTRALHRAVQKSLDQRTRELIALNRLAQEFMVQRSQLEATLLQVEQKAQNLTEEVERLVKQAEEQRTSWGYSHGASSSELKNPGGG